MSAPSVTVITDNALADDLTADEYREIFQELRAGHSLDNLVAMLNSAYSKAHWSRYERGQAELTRRMQNELRLAVGLPPRKPTAAEALQTVDPNAEVVRVGNGAAAPAHRVVLVATRQPVTLHCSQGVEVLPGIPHAASSGGATSLVRGRTRPYSGFSVPTSIYTQLNALRRSEGISWAALMERALHALTGPRAAAEEQP